jgi:hypothetical protein
MDCNSGFRGGKDMKPCPACAEQIEDDAKTCPLCRTALVKTCPYCAEEIQAAAARCRHCNSELGVASGGVGLVEPVSPGDTEAIRKKLRSLNLISFAFGVPGLLLQLAGNGMARAASVGDAGVAALGSLVTLAGAALLIVGLGYYAKLKGRHWAWGFLGLLSCLGLIVLYLIGKRCHHCRQAEGYSRTQCSRCNAPM